MRKKIIAGNWKMNKSLAEALDFLEELKNTPEIEQSNKEIILSIPSLYLVPAREILKDTNIKIFAQDISQYDNGAYTGDISASMLASTGASGTLIGHSERRTYHAENEEICLNKIKLALYYHLTPIYCVGESLNDRKQNKYLEVVESQINEVFLELSPEAVSRIIIAYEPVWAIGTGETAIPQQAQEIHQHIRNILERKFGNEVAQNVSILYGGSVKSENASELFAQKDIDGGLIGGACLCPKSFVKIILAS